MQTGENTQGLRQTIDFTRLLSIALLILHFYNYCHVAFDKWGLTAEITDRLNSTISKFALFNSVWKVKSIALLLLLISLLGAKGKKDQKITISQVSVYLTTGILLYYGAVVLFNFSYSYQTICICYMVLSSTGYLLILTGGTLLSRVLKLKPTSDIFNKQNQTFPQETRLLENVYSINLPASYNHNGKVYKSWINFINPFRGLLICGTPGSGKSYFIIRHVITQHIKKEFSMLIYDFKFDDLSLIAYNTYLKYQKSFKTLPEFRVISFDEIYDRCNPIHYSTLNDLTDAAEAARTILLGLNREWIKRQGDFFVESPVNFLTAVIWFLRKYRNGAYCSLPHVIEFILLDYNDLFSLLIKEKEIEALINPFISAHRAEAMDQLEGQVGSAKIALARLSAPGLYYVLSGNDFTLDINNPQEPKILCLANNPQKQQIYGTVLSLYISTIMRLINQKGKQKCSLIVDEFPTIYLNSMDTLIATARSNKIATTLAMQDMSQLKKDYGKEQAEVIMNLCGNVISGQVTGETAKQLSERFGKINQQRQSLSINSSDTSVSHSFQLENAIPQSVIASLSSGEFVGMVADNPQEPIDLKMFHANILNDHKAIRKEEEHYVPIPKKQAVTAEMIRQNYEKIKQDIQQLVA